MPYRKIGWASIVEYMEVHVAELEYSKTNLESNVAYYHYIGPVVAVFIKCGFLCVP